MEVKGVRIKWMCCDGELGFEGKEFRKRNKWSSIIYRYRHLLEMR